MSDQTRPAGRHAAEPLEPWGAAPTTSVSYDSSQLSAVGARPSLPTYIRQLWGARHFIAYDARVRLSVSQDHTLLGKAWLVLNPVLLGLMFYAIFGLLLQTDRGIENFTGYVMIGFMMFMYSVRSFNAVARCIFSSRALIRGFSFPRAALPFSIAVRDAMSQCYVLAVMVILVILVPPTEKIGPLWLMILPLFVLQSMLNLGIGMLLAPLVHKIPDVANLLNLSTRLLLYSSGLFYDPARFTDNPTILALFDLNPLYQVLSMARELLLHYSMPSWQSWLTLGAWGVGAMVVGLIVFWLNEESYANERR